MRRILTYCIAVLAGISGQGAQAQEISFMPLDEGLARPAAKTVMTPSGDLIAVDVEELIGFRNGRMTARQWNGLFWVKYPPLSSEQFPVSDDNRVSVCWHQGRIYIAGSFRSLDTSRLGIASWNGTSWEKTAGGIGSDYAIHRDISVYDMQSYGNRLFVCGRFNTAGNKQVHNFTVLENNEWFPVQTGSGKINDLHLLNDTLYCAGKFNTVEGVTSRNIAAFYSGTWIPVGSPSSSEIIGLGSFGNSLLAFTADSVFIRTGSVWKPLMQGWDYTIAFQGNTADYDGRLYLAGTFTSLSGTKSHLLQWDAVTWKTVIKEEQVSPKGQLKYFVDVAKSGLFFSGRISSFRNTKVQNMIQLFPGKTIVKGRVFKDHNNNCMFDAGDDPVVNAIVSVNEGQSYTSSDAAGLYAVSLDKDMKSSLRIFPEPDYMPSCQGEYMEIMTGRSDSTVIRDFALEKKPLPPPVDRLSIGSSRGFKARHGYACDYKLSYVSGDEVYPVTLSLKFDKRLQYYSSTIEPSLVTEGEMRWELNTATELGLVLQFPLSIRVGENLTFTLNAQKQQGGGQTEELQQEVVSAFDPNEKQCSADKIGPGWKQLDYHIQFQNLGNDSAMNIYVVDTISQSLPMQFIRILDYSHQQNYGISFRVRDHAIIWSFSGILLPPKSIAGNEASSGFIRFRAGLDQNLKKGDSVFNQAHIYFDYQAPVHTNRVLTFVENNIDPGPNYGRQPGEMILYPNPTGGKLEVSLSPYLIQNVKVYDACGRLVSVTYVSPYESRVFIDLEKPAQGIYTVRVEHTFGVISKKLVVTK